MIEVVIVYACSCQPDGGTGAVEIRELLTLCIKSVAIFPPPPLE